MYTKKKNSQYKISLNHSVLYIMYIWNNSEVINKHSIVQIQMYS